MNCTILSFYIQPHNFKDYYVIVDEDDDDDNWVDRRSAFPKVTSVSTELPVDSIYIFPYYIDISQGAV